ncbi:MAG: hypothetical protein AB1643_02160 [Patescibacteria group bacterium]
MADKVMCIRYNNCPLKGEGCEKDASEDCDLFFYIKKRLIDFGKEIVDIIRLRPFSYDESWYVQYKSELRKKGVKEEELTKVENDAVDSYFIIKGV